MKVGEEVEVTIDLEVENVYLHCTRSLFFDSFYEDYLMYRNPLYVTLHYIMVCLGEIRRKRKLYC